MSYLCRGDPLLVTGPPSRWTDTYLVGRRYASESRSRAARSDRPAGHPLLSVDHRRAPGPRARRPGMAVRVSGRPGPGARARAHVPVHLPGPVGRAVGPGWSLLSGKASGRVAHAACPVFRELVRQVGRRSGGSSFPRFSFETGRPRGDLTLGPTSHSQEQRSAGPR